jgi:hypothetical protein
MKKVVIGTCKLCLREGQELRESHLMPAGMYRRVRSEDSFPSFISGKIVSKTSQRRKKQREGEKRQAEARRYVRHCPLCYRESLA